MSDIPRVGMLGEQAPKKGLVAWKVELYALPLMFHE